MADVKIIDIDSEQWNMKDQKARDDLLTQAQAIQQIQSVLQFDNAPTKNSEKLMKSGALFTAIDNPGLVKNTLVPLESDFADLDTSNGLRVSRYSNGIVKLNGVAVKVASALSTQIIGTIPQGYRPKNNGGSQLWAHANFVDTNQYVPLRITWGGSIEWWGSTGFPTGAFFVIDVTYIGEDI